MKRKKVKIIFWGLFFASVLALGLFLILQKKSGFAIMNQKAEPSGQKAIVLVSANAGPKSPLSGLVCENANRRPFAVMLSADQEARPLSGISQADLVFEMPVVEGGVTRLMAVFVCESPSVIGSVRSARHDFIPLAAGLDAIYAHWGGSHFALDRLKAGIIDNLDALPNPSNVFYRQSGIPMPHNGFTSMPRLVNTAKKLGYRTEGKFSGYQYLLESEVLSQTPTAKILRVDYPGEFRVSYEYIPEKDSYLRYRGGLKEIDKNNRQQVEVKNVVIMRAKSRWLENQYNEVEVEGEGKTEFYINGEFYKGIWKKDKKNIGSKLFFYDEKGQEVKFAPGQIWVEIISPETMVSWE